MWDAADRMNRRRQALELCVGEGDCLIHKRVNEEPCPRCGGEYDEVYQWITKFSDDTRFCICGYEEFPDKGYSLDEWRKPPASWPRDGYEGAETCNHSHFRAEKRRAYSKILVPKSSRWRTVWLLTKTEQHYCRKCGEALRWLDTRYYTGTIG